MQYPRPNHVQLIFRETKRTTNHYMNQSPQMRFQRYIFFRQEGVKENLYVPLNVEVESPDGKILKCRTYQQTATFIEVADIENIPNSRKPSKAYLKTILKGAKESQLPEEYQHFLKRIPDNGIEEVEIKIDI